MSSEVEDLTRQLQKLELNILPYWIGIDLHTGTSAEVETLITQLSKHAKIRAWLVEGGFLYIKLESYHELNPLLRNLDTTYHVDLTGPPIDAYAVIIKIPPDTELDDIFDMLLKSGPIDQYEKDNNYLYVLYENEYDALNAVNNLSDSLDITYDHIEYDPRESMVVD